MNVELVSVKTSDRMRLHGALHTPRNERSSGDDSTVDAVILTHGVGSNFYSSVMMESICESLHEVGITTLRINTRGHDAVATVATDLGGRQQGAAFETVDQCRLDLQAWTDLLVDRGFQQVGWLGHSLGALKVLYAHAYQPHDAVKHVIGISPPRLAFTRFTQGSGREAFASSWAEAQRLLETQQPATLFQATFPMPLIMSAATFVDKYGPEEKYNLLRFTRMLRDRITLIFGEKELDASNTAFAGFVEELESAKWATDFRKILVIPQANHFYSGCLPALRHTIGSCL